MTRDRDRWPELTWFAVAGLPIAALLGMFGMPPVDVHGPLHYLGIMGPFCGMTRGLAAFVAGDVVKAVSYNPASVLLVPGAVLVLVRAVRGRSTGRWFDVVVTSRRLLPMVVVAVLVLTVNQQLSADLLAG